MLDTARKPATYDEIVRGLPEEIVAASRKVDPAIRRWLLSIPPFQRVAWSMRVQAELESYLRDTGTNLVSDEE
jgi:hypothetical protein